MAEANATDIYDGNTGRKCWATARERNRMRARYAIRQRVFGNRCSNDENTSSGANNLSHEKDERSNRYGAQNGEKIQEVLRRIVHGDTSYFSVLFMEENHSLVNDVIPTALLWENDMGNSVLLEYQRLRSRLGGDGVALFETYVSGLETCTVMEYAAWLKRYRIIRQLILGGIDPTIRGMYRHRGMSDRPHQENDERETMGAAVQKQFFAGFVPLSLSCYVVSRVIELRRSSWTRRQSMDMSTGHIHATCAVCEQAMDQNLLLTLLPNSCSSNSCSLHHQFCEGCLWMDILKHLNYRQDDVVACPVCCVNSLDEIIVQMDNTSHSISKTISQQRYEESLRRYNELPRDSLTVKKSCHKKKHIPEYEMLYSNWSDAVLPSLGWTQTARRDKFLHSAERGSFHYIKGCLDNGIDVNLQNEYGQTALLIAVWLNFQPIVRLLLDFGGDPCISANGNVTCWSVAIRNSQNDILEMLHMACGNDVRTASLLPSISSDRSLQLSSASFSQLIDWSSHHPGAGSFILDDCFADLFLDSLMALWSSLPLEVSAKKKSGPCSERSYYCDVYGTITTALSSALTNAASNHTLPFSVVTCGSQMRFLSYLESAAVLPPHIDLSRTDPQTEARSTHSFLLYVTTCDQGGETSLIGDVTGDGRNVVIANVAPKRGRVLVFPHRCPHEGLVVVDTPKVLIRGELWLAVNLSK